VLRSPANNRHIVDRVADMQSRRARCQHLALKNTNIDPAIGANENQYGSGGTLAVRLDDKLIARNNPKHREAIRLHNYSEGVVARFMGGLKHPDSLIHQSL
jgi:hypothetical protein